MIDRFWFVISLEVSISLILARMTTTTMASMMMMMMMKK